jgi:hypothetical protein
MAPLCLHLFFQILCRLRGPTQYYETKLNASYVSIASSEANSSVKSHEYNSVYQTVYISDIHCDKNEAKKRGIRHAGEMLYSLAR